MPQLYAKSQCEVSYLLGANPFLLDLVVDIPYTGCYIAIDSVLTHFPYMRWELLSLARKEYETIFRQFGDQGYVHFDYLRRQHEESIDPCLHIFVNCADQCFRDMVYRFGDGKAVFH